jgi:chaperonin GroES
MGLNIKPLGDRIVVERVDEDIKKSTGGIIIPDTAKEKPTEGKVMAAGSGKRLKDGTLLPLNVKVGDRILFGKWGGSEVKIDGKEYVILNEDDVYGIIE